MKKILFCIMLISFMICTPLGFLVGEVCVPQVNAEVEGPIIIENLEKFQTMHDESANMEADYVLAVDLVLEENSVYKGIGTKENPFKGSFDGQGHSITFSGCILEGESQGLFAYTENATIKNVKVNYQNVSVKTVDPALDEVKVGLVVGSGVNTTIENCEIQGSVINYSKGSNGGVSEPEIIPITCKFTFGGIIGQAERVTINKCGVYLDVDLIYSQANVFTNKFGGLVGQVDNYTNINFCVAYIRLGLAKSNLEIASENQVGGLAGSVSGSYTTITNCTADFVYGFFVQELDGEGNVTVAEDTYKVGALFGYITNVNPANGNLRSCGYYAYDAVEQKQNENFVGDKNGYEHKKGTDNLVSLSERGVLGTQSFFEGDTVVWDLNTWDFSTDWIIASSQLRLQQYQIFDYSLKEILDINNLLEKVDYNADNYKGIRYGTNVELKVTFVNVEDFQYFKILQVLKDGAPVQEGMYTLTPDNKTSPTYFTLTLEASAETEGEYSFVTTAIQYYAYVQAGEGGKVKTQSSSSLVNQLKKRALMKDGLPYTVQAKPEYQYKFVSWTLWQQISQESYDSTDAGNYMTLTEDGDTTYWKKEHTKLNHWEVTMQLGTDAFKSNFIQSPNSILLQANFEQNVYQINIGNFDVKSIKKVEVVYDRNNTNRVKVFDKNTQLSDYLIVDRNENLLLRFYIKKPYELLTDKFDAKLALSLKSKPQEVVVDDESVTVYEFSMNANTLKDFVEEDKYSFEVYTKASKEKAGKGMPLWLILTIVGGGLLLIGAVVIIIVKVKRKRNNSSNNNFDYNKYFS